MRKKKIIFFLIIFVSFFTVLFYIQKHYESLEKRNSDFYEISVICRGRSMDNYSSVKAGIDQAADDLNAEVNYITLSKDNDAVQQVSLIKQEAGNGTNAIIIFPADDMKDAKSIREAAREVPVIALQHEAGSLPYITTISCDEYKLGKALAQKIIKDEGSVSNINFKILQSSSHKNDSQLLNGVETALKKVKADVSLSVIPDNSKSAYNAVKAYMTGTGERDFIALDSSSLEAAGKVKKDLLKSGAEADKKIYGIGRTDTNVAMLEDNIIQAIGVENEYSMGYLSVKIAVDGIQKKYTENNIKVNFIISDKSDMYYPQNEYMLFPFINY